MPLRKPSAPLLILLFAVGVAAISFSSIFIRWSHAPVSVIAMYRLYLTNLILIPFFWREKKVLLSLARKQWLLLILSGVALGLHFLFWMESLRLTTVASSTAILTLEPVFVMLGSFWMFRQRIAGKAMTGMLTAISGSLLVGWGDFGLSGEALTGDFLSLLGTAAVAVHMLLGQRLRSSLSAMTYSMLVFFFAASVLGIYNAAYGFSFGGYSGKEWSLFGLVALIPTIFGHYLFNWLLRYMNASSVSMSVLGEPIGATLLAWWLLGERVTGMQLLAGLLVVTGVAWFLKTTTYGDGPIPKREKPDRKKRCLAEKG